MNPQLNRRDRGAVMPIVALLLPVILVMTAFAVDLGRQRSDRRSMQAAADVVALDMSRLADGRTIADITAGDPSQPALKPPAATALAESAARNDVDPAQLEFDWGTFDEATATFLSLNMDPVAIPDAVLVTARDTTDFYFQPGSGDVVRTAVARYGMEPTAGFKVGSFGAALNSSQSTLLASIVSPLLGNPATLTAVGYQGLAGASVNLGQLGTQMGLLTPEQLFTEQVSLSDAMLASAEVLRQNGNDSQADILEGAVTSQTDGMMFSFADVVSADGGSETSGAGADIDVLGMIQAVALTSTCQTNPTGFQDCTGLSIPNLQTPLPGAPASSAGVVKVIQGPQYHYGPVGTGINTGQVQVAVNTTVGRQSAGPCVPSLSNGLCLVSGLLVNNIDATVRLDGLVTLVGGRNDIDAIDCQDPSTLGLVVGSDTRAYQVALTLTVEFRRLGTLGQVIGQPLGNMVFSITTNPAVAAEAVPFTVPPDVLGQTVKTTSPMGAGLSTLTVSNVNGTGALSTIATYGVSIGLTQVVNTYVNPVISALDSQVVSPLGQLLGVNVTGSDITAQSINCDFGKVQLVG